MSDRATHELQNGEDEGEDLRSQKRLSWSVTAAISTFIYEIIVVIVAWYSSTSAQEIIKDFWWLFAALGILIPLLPLLPWIRDRINRSGHSQRIGLIIFGVIPVLIFLVIAIALFEPWLQYTLIRTLLLFVFCLFPGSMYYLFIVSRRESLLSEYLSQLDRLGLLDGHGNQNVNQDSALNDSNFVRIRSYFERFAAEYGGEVEMSELESAIHGKSYDKVRIDQTNLFWAETSVPIIGATILIAIGWFVTFPPIVLDFVKVELRYIDWSKILLPEYTPVNMGFLGAYFFSVQMIYRRYLRNDLGANAYVAISLRIIIVFISVWVLNKIWISAVEPSTVFQLSVPTNDVLLFDKNNTILVISFIIGVFPLVLWQLLRNAAKKFPGIRLSLPNLSTTLPVSDLDGLTVWHEARLQEEDIENIPNMATTDIVELMLHTRVPPNRIIDWVDQAILYRYLDVNNLEEARKIRQQLRQYGIRTASGLVKMYCSKFRADGEGITPEEKTAEVATILPDGGSIRFNGLVQGVLLNPNLALILRWRGIQI